MISLVDVSTGPVLATFIASPAIQHWMLKRTRGITYRGINIETLKELPLPLPPFAEQSQIVTLVEENLTLAESVRQASSVNQVRSQRLRQSILKRAFEGRLVPQDPSDEPAEALLERIRAAREAETKAKRPKKPRKRSKKGRAKQKELWDAPAE